MSDNGISLGNTTAFTFQRNTLLFYNRTKKTDQTGIIEWFTFTDIVCLLVVTRVRP